MIDIPDLTPHLLAELGEELGGCDFTHESQTRFLGCRTSCDVQAVPGNGKTTLLAAKLALLSRTWRSRTQGVCVISHTNAARHEVERNLLLASDSFGVPQLPALHRHRDELHESVPRVTVSARPRVERPAYRRRRIRGYGVETLPWQAALCPAHSRMRRGQCRNQVETWVRNLELASDFECAGDSPRGSSAGSGVARDSMARIPIAAAIWRN
jgi:hypothetical protein